MNAPIRIKSFRARTLNEAIHQVRTELGPDAVILETKQAPRSRFSWSRCRVEVTASCGSIAATPSELTRDNLACEPAESTAPIESLSSDRPVDPTAPSHRTQPEKGTCYPEAFIEVASQLLHRDLPADRIDLWLRRALNLLGPDVRDPWVVRACLSQIVREEIEWEPPTRNWTQTTATLAVVGPSGHGKSSAVAKLASLASLQYGLRPLIIACRHGSAAIHPRLADYCSLMGWGYEQIDAPKLRSAIAASKERCDWMVLDVPGIALGDWETLEWWRSQLGELAVSQTHLTLSATTGLPHARRLLDWYHGLLPSHLLATRVDEAQGLGSLYPFLRSSNLPLGFVSVGPKIPGDLQESDPARLASWILGCEADPPPSED